MIESIALRNYRGHTDTVVPCGRLTVLVGENATGKTSALRAVQSISDGITPTLPAYLLRRGSTELEIGLKGRGPDGGWHIRARYELRDGQDVLHETEGAVANDDGTEGRRPQATFLSLSPEDLAAPSASQRVVPDLEPSGRGLASVLAYLKLAETERFQRIVDRLHGVVPITRGIGFTRIAATETVPRLIRVEDRQVELSDKVTTIQDALVFDFAEADKVPAPLVSEGTLITLGILTALEVFHRERHAGNGGRTGATPVDVVLVDDVDRALHPRAQHALVATLRAALDATPNLQILATSHSPYLIDALRPEEVVVLGRNAQGAVVAKRLDGFPDDRLRDMLSTGELWMSEGDEWVAR
jgi:predicted ATPase